MNKVWKWIIGIVVVLVVLAILAGGAFILRSHMMNAAGFASRAARPVPQLPGNRLPNTPNNGNNGNGNQRYPGMMPFGNGGMGGRGMYMGGFGGMNPFGGLLGSLVSLGFLVLIVLAIIWLARNLQRPLVVAAAPVAPVNQVAPAVATHPCQKCAEPVQENWTFCPNCGERV